MAGIFSVLSRPSTYNEPQPRIGHVSFRVGSQLVVQGGRTKDFSEENREHLNSVVDILDNYTEKWEQKPVTGEAPSPGTYAAASTSLANDLLLFGGYDGNQFFNTLYKLDTESWLWNQLSPQNADGAPMPKCGCGMISLGDSIGVLGGYGTLAGPTEPQSFMKDSRFKDGGGWTNEFHTYNVSQGVWSCPITTGEKPPPCAGLTITAVDDRRAVMFGGKNIPSGNMNHMYILDYSNMNWRKLQNSESDPWPGERYYHAACCLNYGQKFPQLLMAGGLNKLDKPLDDIWAFDVEKEKWRKVNVTKKARWGHSLTAFSLGPGLVEVLEFGGSSDPIVGFDNKQTKMADTTLLQFMLVESSGQSQWELLSIADKKQLGSPERMIEKMKLIMGDRDKLKKREGEVEERVRMVEEDKERLKVKVQLLQAKAIEEKARANQEKERANELQRRLDEVERKEHEKTVVQEQAMAAEQRGPSWEVGEDELEDTDETLGIGGWAVVKVAKMKVAAKCLHSQLVYDYHRHLFRREMDVAARVSHPNCLRFLGARLEGGMAILTEFMPTSLRALVNRRPRQPIPMEHILSIAVDVARALNYLHNMTPDPIIHRDLSSANVLLQPSPNGGWLAKVSDYGTANFQNQLRTENPGSPVYTAPESRDPALQTPKMDIYSFGVLLVEMCTCEFPTPERRGELMESIYHERLLDLIRQCLNEDKDRRPTAAELVDCLQMM